MDEQEKTFLRTYPPIYLVFQQDSGSNSGAAVFEVSLYESLILLESGEEDERVWVLKEASKSLRIRYGDTLAFTEPELCTSLVYRSEREFLEDYEERFAWKVHFYECAAGEERPRAVRYSGFVFIRPEAVFCGASIFEAAARNHDMSVAPAVCEGYLRPPKLFDSSPYACLCSGDYARPYGHLPFDSVPAMPSLFGASCGHSILATAMIMSLGEPAYSPYELAVALAHLRSDKAEEDGLIPSEGLRLRDIKHLLPMLCDTRGDIGTVPLTGDPAADVKRFSDDLCLYLYQRIPVLLPTNHAVLTDSRSDAEVSQTPYERKEGEERHMILVHGIVRTGPGPCTDPQFIYSDSTDLHTTGDIYHRVSCQRLIDSRLRCPETDKGEHEVYYGICLPRGFDVTRGDVYRRIKDLKNAAGFTKLTLRNSKQLKGYLLRTFFPGTYHESRQCRSEVRKLREELRKLDLPDYVWVAAKADNSQCYLFDTRSRMAREEPLGEFPCTESGLTTARFCIHGISPGGGKVSIKLGVLPGGYLKVEQGR